MFGFYKIRQLIIKHSRFVNKHKIKTYLSGHEVKKLHIGCGSHVLDGWLNVDLEVQNWSQIVFLDATKKFPFANDQFDYIFSEHTIEHLSYPNGARMLYECFRVLKENGKIRIATPDLKVLIDLYKEPKIPLQKKYIMWSTCRFLRDVPYVSSVFVINNAVRDWGHQFIYDEKTLQYSLQRVGFSNIVRCNLQESEDKQLCSLENLKRMSPDLCAFETFTLEATKKNQKIL